MYPSPTRRDYSVDNPDKIGTARVLPHRATLVPPYGGMNGGASREFSQLTVP